MLDQFLSSLEKIMPEKWRWLLSHEGFRRYFANTGWMFGGQIVSLLIAFFIGAWIARYLGPQEYGRLNYAVAFSGVFSFLASLGVDAILSRELVKHPEKRDVLLGTALRFKIIGGLLAFGSASLAALIWENDHLTRLLIVFISGTFIFQALNIISSFFQAAVAAKKNVQVQFFANIISSILKIIIILSGGGVFFVMLAYALDFFWQGLGFIFVYRRAGLKFRSWYFDPALARLLWRDSWPLMLTGAAVLIYVKIDQVIIGRLLGDGAVGLYAAAVKIAEAWYFIPSVICASLFPAIINAKKISAAVYVRRLNSLYLLLAGSAFIIALIISALSRPLIIGLFGREYLEAVLILRIYIWSGVGLFWGWAISQYLVAENALKLMFAINFLSMLTNIVLNFWFISLWGLPGAALATLISYSLAPLVIVSRNLLKSGD